MDIYNEKCVCSCMFAVHGGNGSAVKSAKKNLICSLIGPTCVAYKENAALSVDLLMLTV